MKKIDLNNNTVIPMIGFGTYLLQGEDCYNATKEAIKIGYRMIDTAEGYGNEKEVGLAIKDSNIDRKELFITTKVHFKSYEKTKEVVYNSLKNLQTDYLDLVLLHWPFGNYYKARRDLEDLYKEGKIKAIGISNFEPNQFIDLIHFNKVIPVINQIEMHLYNQRVDERKYMEKYNIQPMAYAPLGQGRIHEIFTLDEVKEIANKYNKTTTQVLLRFLTQKDVIIIPRSKSVNHIKENFELFDFTLTDEEMNILTNLDKKLVLMGNPQSPEKVEKAINW